MLPFLRDKTMLSPNTVQQPNTEEHPLNQIFKSPFPQRDFGVFPGKKENTLTKDKS